MRTFAGLLVLIVSALGVGCSDEGGSGTVVANSNKITGSNLNSSFAPSSKLMATACSFSGVSSLDCDPDNATGRLLVYGPIWGNSSENGGAGNHLISMGTTDATILQDPSSTTSEGSATFNLASPVTNTGSMYVPTEAPSTTTIWRVEVYVDYADITFTITNGANSTINATHTIRQVFRESITADDMPDAAASVTASSTEDGEGMVGEKLYKDSDDSFKWCSTAAGTCTETTRPADISTYQDSRIRSGWAAVKAGTNPGNAKYGLLSFDIPSASQFTATLAEVQDTTRLWTINFNMDKGIHFEVSSGNLDGTGMDTLAELVAAFRINIAVNAEGQESLDNTISATVTLGDAGSGSSSSVKKVMK